MAKRHTTDEQQGAPTRIERWFNTVEAAAFLGLTESQLREWRVQRRGPRFKKFGTKTQSPVAYPESWLIEYQNSVRTVETDNYDETEKAS